MQLTRLELLDFRNYERLELEPGPGLTAFVGPNAQGKSNLLEAVAMLGTGKSFRAQRDGSVIRYGCERTAITGQALLRAGAVNLGCAVVRGARGTRKAFAVNGNDVRYARFLGHLRIVTFVPSDLQLIGGAPALRRALLNGALAQAEPRYYRELARYMQTLAQKNALLRAGAPLDSELLDVYNGTLVESAAVLVPARAQFVRELDASAARSHARFTAGAEALRIEYAPDVAGDPFDPGDVARALERRLREAAELERVRKTSVAGPHRDDITLTLDGRSLATYGSQGQQRTAILALKLAEYATLRDRSGEAPLLLLDDVLSELDDERAAAFVDGLGGYEQVFLTAVQLPAALRSGAHVYAIERARVASVAC
jgi:DNA replication and repair protein RecF